MNEEDEEDFDSRLAYTSDRQIVLAERVHYGQGPFYCCDGHKLKLRKSSGLPDKRRFRAHFAHKGESGCKGGCGGGGGESAKHLYAKTLLREHVGRYAFAVTRCSECKRDLETVETRGDDCVPIEVVEEGARRWRYDCCLVRGGKRIACLEVYNSSKCNLDKVRADRGAVPLAEFRVDDVLRLESAENCLVLPNQLCESAPPCAECVQRARAAAEREAARKAKAALQAEADRRAEAKRRAEAAQIEAERKAKAARIEAEHRANVARIQADQEKTRKKYKVEHVSLTPRNLQIIEQARAVEHAAVVAHLNKEKGREEAWRAESRVRQRENTKIEPHTPIENILATRVTPVGIFRDGVLIRAFR